MCVLELDKFVGLLLNDVVNMQAAGLEMRQAQCTQKRRFLRQKLSDSGVKTRNDATKAGQFLFSALEICSNC